MFFLRPRCRSISERRFMQNNICRCRWRARSRSIKKYCFGSFNFAVSGSRKHCTQFQAQLGLACSSERAKYETQHSAASFRAIRLIALCVFVSRRYRFAVCCSLILRIRLRPETICGKIITPMLGHWLSIPKPGRSSRIIAVDAHHRRTFLLSLSRINHFRWALTRNQWRDWDGSQQHRSFRLYGCARFSEMPRGWLSESSANPRDTRTTVESSSVQTTVREMRLIMSQKSLLLRTISTSHLASQLAATNESFDGDFFTSKQICAESPGEKEKPRSVNWIAKREFRRRLLSLPFSRSVGLF